MLARSSIKAHSLVVRVICKRRPHHRAKVRMLVAAIALVGTTLVACTDGPGLLGGKTDPTIREERGPVGEIVPSEVVSISAPGIVSVRELFRVGIRAPVKTQTAYVYWQVRESGAWRTFAFTTDGPEERRPVYLEYPVSPGEMPSVDGVFPETRADPTFQMTLAPPAPGRYRIVKAFTTPGSTSHIWAGAEIRVRPNG